MRLTLAARLLVHLLLVARKVVLVVGVERVGRVRLLVHHRVVLVIALNNTFGCGAHYHHRVAVLRLQTPTTHMQIT